MPVRECQAARAADPILEGLHLLALLARTLRHVLDISLMRSGVVVVVDAVLDQQLPVGSDAELRRGPAGFPTTQHLAGVQREVHHVADGRQVIGQ